MTLLEVEKEADRLTDEEQRRLISHLISRRVQRNVAYKQELARRLADKDPSKWISLDDAERRLSQR